MLRHDRHRDPAVTTSDRGRRFRIADGGGDALAVTALPSEALPVPGIRRARWQVELIRCRAGESADFVVEACDGARTHLSLEKDAPVSRAVDRAGHILCRPILGGLHHQYARIYFTTGTTKMARPSRSIPLWGNPLVPAVTLIS